MRIGPQWVGRHRLARHEGIHEARRLSLRGQPPFGSDLIAWFAASDVSGGSGASVSTWKDRSPHGNDLIQNTGANQPTLQTDVMNGYPVVRFDGSDDFLQTAADTSLEVANPACYVALEPTNDTEDAWVVGHPHDTTSTDPFFRWGLFRQTGTSQRVLIRWDGTLVTNNAGNYADRISTIRQYWSVMDASFRLFDGERANGTDADVTYPNSTGFIVGANVDGSQAFTGDIAEVLLYDGSHTAAERQDVLFYLSSKYGLAA